MLRRPIESTQYTSIGSVGDSFDNALADSVNGLYKSELSRGPIKDHGEASTTSNSRHSAGVHWHTTQRLHGYLNDVPPAEFYAAQQANQHVVGIK